MTRGILLGILGSALAAGLALAKPARPIYEPPPSPQLPTRRVDFNGTSWNAVYRNQQMTYLFEDKGALSYLYGPGKTRWPNRGTWKADQKTVYFEMLNKRLEFNGALEDHDTLVGEIRESDGTRMAVTLKRSEPAR